MYIQHAEVTSLFPTLDFDISILRNRASLEIYQEIGPIAGDAYVVSREEMPFEPARFDLAISSDIRVGVYLTSQVDWSGVRRVVSSLRENSGVGHVFIKPHPSQSLARIEQECPSVAVETRVPVDPHVAVVANSSVVIELLHRSVPVFQYYGMDSVPADYYGFSAQGVTEKLDLDDLRRPFWRSFAPEETWLSKFSRYDPWADPHAHEEEARLVVRLGEFFSAAEVRERQSLSNPERMNSRSQACVAQLLLKVAPNTVIDSLNDPERFLTDERNESYDDLYVGACESLFANRDPMAYDIFASTRQTGSVNSNFVYQTKRRDIELSGRSSNEQEIEGMRNYLLARQASNAEAWRGNVQFMMLLLRLGDHKRLSALISQTDDVRLAKMHINQRIALVKWLRQRPLSMSELGLNPADFYAGLSSFLRIKLRLMTSDEAMFHASPWTHEEMEDLFLASTGGGVQRDFETIFQPCYRKLRSQLQYMDVRWSSEERSRLLGRIEQAIEDQDPFSLVRLSDGEGYVFSDCAQFFTMDDARLRERHWWREELPSSLRTRLLPQMQEASARADVLGIPCVYRLWRDAGGKNDSLIGTVQGRGLAEVLTQVAAGNNRDQLYSEEKCNLPVFSDLKTMSRFAKMARKFVVVASVKEEEIRQLFPTVEDLDYILIPTHSRTVGNERYERLGATLPHVYEEIRDRVRCRVGPGTLVLVAAGVIGKIFVGDVRECGGVGLDIGSSLDEWIEAGIHSLH
jgi:hypothetical protein